MGIQSEFVSDSLLEEVVDFHSLGTPRTSIGSHSSVVKQFLQECCNSSGFYLSCDGGSNIADGGEKSAK